MSTIYSLYCLRKLILDRWGPYDENFDLVCRSFLTLFTEQRLPFWFSCEHESVADHMTWLIYHQPMKISHTKLFCSVLVRMELILQVELNITTTWKCLSDLTDIYVLLSNLLSSSKNGRRPSSVHKWIKLHSFVQLWKRLYVFGGRGQKRTNTDIFFGVFFCWHTQIYGAQLERDPESDRLGHPPPPTHHDLMKIYQVYWYLRQQKYTLFEDLHVYSMTHRYLENLIEL